MRRFTLWRSADRVGDGDPSPLGEGVQFSDGSTVVRWLNRSTEVWDRWDEDPDDPGFHDVERVVERTYGGAVAVVWARVDFPASPALTLVRGARHG